MWALVILIAVIIFALGYLLIYFNGLWIYKFLDRALRNDRNALPRAYELPRYFKLNKNGQVDTSVRWPGWDGWYLFMLPADQNLPVKMVRASLMTGLYGLEGIDDYEKLLLRSSSFESIEYLTLIPSEESINGRKETKNNLCHFYLAKPTDLRMDSTTLDVTMTGIKGSDDEKTEQYGRVSGSWPQYRFEFSSPTTDIDFALNFQGEHILWWADIPHIFTYFAAFGRAAGTITYKRGTTRRDVHNLADVEEVYPIEGVACFEHGFARKPFNFDRFSFPITLAKKAIPSLKILRYHYELFVSGDDLRGGFMFARGFGIDFRNRGGLYHNGQYKEIRNIKIQYMDDPEADLVDIHCSGRPPVKFYRRWRLEAETTDGMLEYIGTREWPPASIGRNMIYYHFSYQGVYAGQSMSGRGYGEYAHL